MSRRTFSFAREIAPAACATALWVALALAALGAEPPQRAAASPAREALPAGAASTGAKWTRAQALKAGKDLAGGRCEDEGPAVLTAAPMRAEDFAMIVPYGMVVGGHVTPIDHQYFAPRVFNSPRDAYEVYAMADARLVEIQPRTNERGTEYRMVFSVTCTFLYYYDLVTRLAPEVQRAYDRSARGRVELRVKAGQWIGRIGGQTLDFAVWDTTRPLPGFIVPEQYQAEPWKRFTADPLDYCTPELRALLLSKYARTAEPRSGKIDHDIDGRLVGNWFQEGSGGYGGARGTGHGEYWRGHLSFAPNAHDPAAFLVSIGDYAGQARQFAVRGNAPLPQDVSVSSGAVEYDLVPWNYVKPDGSLWDRVSPARDLRLIAPYAVQGCVRVQLIEDRKLRLEIFPGKTSAEVDAFGPDARLYTR